MPEAQWCWNHHPDYEQARRRRASKGGKRGGRGRPQAELSDIKARLSDLADDVLEGRQDKGVAAVGAQVLNVYLRAISVETKLNRPHGEGKGHTTPAGNKRRAHRHAFVGV